MAKKNQSSYYLYGAAAIVVVGLLAFVVGQSQEEASASVYAEFAQCLTESGATMYGAWWCPHCESQKDLFGAAWDYVEYVECSTANRTMNQTCRNAGIEGYPTWIFGDDTRQSGELPLAVIAQRSGCALPDVTE